MTTKVQAKSKPQGVDDWLEPMSMVQSLLRYVIYCKTTEMFAVRPLYLQSITHHFMHASKILTACPMHVCVITN
jgi:hypothetical protein